MGNADLSSAHIERSGAAPPGVRRRRSAFRVGILYLAIPLVAAWVIAAGFWAIMAHPEAAPGPEMRQHVSRNELTSSGASQAMATRPDNQHMDVSAADASAAPTVTDKDAPALSDDAAAQARAQNPRRSPEGQEFDPKFDVVIFAQIPKTGFLVGLELAPVWRPSLSGDTVLEVENINAQSGLRDLVCPGDIIVTLNRAPTTSVTKIAATREFERKVFSDAPLIAHVISAGSGQSKNVKLVIGNADHDDGNGFGSRQAAGLPCAGNLTQQTSVSLASESTGL